jgi:Uma2 family endonuclease
MPTATLNKPAENLAQVLHELGDITPERIGFPVGTATEEDLIAYLDAADKKLYELVDGFLVEKLMGFKESFLAASLYHHLTRYLENNERGLTFGADGPVRLRAGRIRLPDTGFVSWERIPWDEMPDDPILDAVPELAVEVISRGNKPREMQRKLADFFEAGVLLVWFIYPKTQTVEVYTSPTHKKVLTKDQTLDGGKVLPGFSLPLKKLFAVPKRPAKGKKNHG